VKLLDVPKEGDDGVDWGDDEPIPPEEPCRDPNWCFDGQDVRALGKFTGMWRRMTGVLPPWGPGKKKKGHKDEKPKKDYSRVPTPVLELDCEVSVLVLRCDGGADGLCRIVPVGNLAHLTQKILQSNIAL